MSFRWNLPNTGIEPVSLMSPELAGGFFTTSTIWEALLIVSCIYLFQKCHLVGIIQYFVFQTLHSCTHLNLFTHLALRIDVSSVSFHGLVPSFLLLPNNIPLFVLVFTVCLLSQLSKTSWLLPIFGNYK